MAEEITIEITETVEIMQKELFGFELARWITGAGWGTTPQYPVLNFCFLKVERQGVARVV